MRFLSRCISGLFVCLAGTAVSIFAAEAGELRPLVLRLPYSPQFQFAGLYAAQAKGFFRARGLEVTLVHTRNEMAAPIEDVLSGGAAFGILQGPQLVTSRMEGKPVVVIAAIMQHSPQALVARADSGIRTPHDLVGKRVALDRTSMVSEVRMMLEREGLDFGQLRVVENRWDTNELITRVADAMSTFVIDGPYYLRQQGVEVNVIRPVDYGVDFYGDCLFTTESIARDDRPLVEAVRAAVLEGWAYALREPAELVEWIATHLPDRPERIDRALMMNEAREVARLVNADLVELGHMNRGRWEAMAVGMGLGAPGGDFSRLDDFLFQMHRPPGEVLRWAWWVLLAASAVVSLTLLANRRLKRLVERRTGELRVSERHYRRLFELSPVAMVEFGYERLQPWFEELRAAGVTDLEKHFRDHPESRQLALSLSPLTGANPVTLRVVGAASVEDLRTRLPELVTPGTAAARLGNMVRLWQGFDYSEGELPYRHLQTGEIRYFSYYWRMARDADGRLSFGQAQTALIDVTEKRRAEQALRESEERYRSLFAATPNPMWIYDLETLRFIAVNDAAVAEYGYTREEFMAMDILDIRPPDEVERMKTVVGEYREDQPHKNRIWRHRRKDGSIKLVDVSAQTITQNGRRCVLVLPFDLTAKIQAEEALRESEARYRTLFENAVGGVYRTTVDGRVITANPALARILGFETPAELIAWYSDRIGDSFYVKPGRRAEFLAAVGQGDGVTNFESEVRGKDGRMIWISENVRAVRDGNGRLVHLDGFVSDITPRRQLELEYQRASKLEAVGILAGGIAHDFNNILTVVLGNVTLAEMDSESLGPVAQLLREAKRATLRARDLTQQLLTFAKGGDPVRATVELPELVRESAGFALHGAKARAEFELADDLWPAMADKGQLGQVLQNLVINSVQAMPDGGIVRIGAGNETVATGAIASLPAGRYVKITVADSGVGIAAEHLTKIFDPYFTTKQQGSGLGLATVYSIVRKHDGHIEVASQLGVGTAFSIWLPAAEAQPVAPDAPAGSGSPFQSRVLFMDDEPTIRQIAVLFLRRLGAECETAADGAEALVKYRKAQADGRGFDAVIMDLTVPGGMGGREAMEQLLRIDPQVKAIVSSGYSRDPVLANYRSHGFKGILPKPYGLDQLRRVLREVTSVVAG